MHKTKVYLLSGFLGTGKTTLLNHLLKTTYESNISVLVNDFGQIGVDAALLETKDSDTRVYEINGGSIFCTCLKASFLQGLQKAVETEPHVLIIEGSGLSDPSSFNKIVSGNNMSHLFGGHTVICLLDPIKSFKLFHVLPVIENQIRVADYLVINKTDIASEKEISAIVKIAEKVNPDAVIFKTVMGQVDFSKFTPQRNNSPGKEETCQTPEDRPASLHLVPPDSMSVMDLTENLKPVLPHIMRLKGFVVLKDGIYFLSDNAGSVEYKKLTDPVSDRHGLVILCQKEQQSTVLRLWQKLLL